MTRLACVAALAAWIGLSPLPGQTKPIALVGARILDGTGGPPLERGALLVRDGKVEAVGPMAKLKVPAGAQRIDVSGKTILPGFVNAHGHVGETQGLRSGPQFYNEENVLRQLGLYARYGVTTVFSLGGDREAAVRLRDSQSTPPLDRARIYLAGPVITADTPEAARRMVDSVAAMKVDIVKIRVDDQLGATKKMTKPVYQAVIDQAHRHGLRVAAHIFYLEDAKSLLQSGVDYVAHSVRDHDIDDETIALLKKRDVCLCPTLTREVSTFVYGKTPEFFSDPFFLREADRSVLQELQAPQKQQEFRESKAGQRYEAGLEVANRNLKKLSEAGVRIAFGTDTGPPARFQGYFEHMEMELMAKAGLTAMQILNSATGDAARCMQLAGQVGTLQPGAWADFLVLRANPLDNINNTKTLESVWIAGNRLSAGKPPR